MNDDYDDFSRVEFADPGGRSALRASSKNNPRNLPCPICGEKNRRRDVFRRVELFADVLSQHAAARAGHRRAGAVVGAAGLAGRPARADVAGVAQQLPENAGA